MRLGHGFTENKQWLTNLSSFLDSMTKRVIKGHAADPGYLDLSGALGKVSHVISLRIQCRHASWRQKQLDGLNSG